MMSVSVEENDSLTVGSPRKLFDGPYVWERSRNYDVSPDAERFVMLQHTQTGDRREEIRIVVNWTAVLGR